MDWTIHQGIFHIRFLSVLSKHTKVLATDLVNEAVENNPSKFPGITLPIELFAIDRKDKGIRPSYERVFGTSAKGVIASLADQHLDYIFAIRNLFAHKAGRNTDQRYPKPGSTVNAKQNNPSKYRRGFPSDWLNDR